MLFLNVEFFALIVLAVVDVSVGICTEPFRGRDVLDNVPLIDGNNALSYNIWRKLTDKLTDYHLDANLTNDLSWGNAACPTCSTDLPRMIEGKIGGQFWAINTACSSMEKKAPQLALEQIDIIRRLIKKYPNNLQLVTNAADIEPVWKSGKIASMIAIEGAPPLGKEVSLLRIYHELGVRSMSLDDTCQRPWSHVLPVDNGFYNYALSEYGKRLILEMNRLGMIVDFTHFSARMTRTALEVTRAPIIFSHSSAFAICNHIQNIPDDVLLSVKANNGIVMVNFGGEYVTCNKSRKATIEDVVAHINYIRKLIGADHVGIGANYDATSKVSQGLEDVSKYPVLFDRLYNNRENEPTWSAEDLEKLAGRNFIRVFHAVEAVRDCLASESPWEGVTGNETMRPVECQITNKWINIMRRSNIAVDKVPSRRQIRRFMLASNPKPANKVVSKPKPASKVASKPKPVSKVTSKPKPASKVASKPNHRQVESSIEK